MKRRTSLIGLTIVGLVVILVYLGTATGIIKDVNKIILILAFAIGPVAIVGVIEIYHRLSTGGNSLILKTGTVFLITAFALFNLMLVVQQMIFMQFEQFRSNAADEATKQAFRLILKGVNLVQMGIDVSFDIFYCAGLILISLVMYRHPKFGKFLGVFGVVSAAGLLILNLYAFPYIPADSGLIDLGPLTGLWWLAVVIQLFRLDRRDKQGFQKS